ncbi:MULTISPECIES: FAD-dependent oxidoreductase [unclassified Mesorhizobium]|uniref:FAD-dependent oxidoreductase n=1 Tax=unclassified Mesorhizobium TaxID=325217 RepID=UPI002479E7E9|nr:MULTISPECIES: FAD-dependent oxidoreductase [unclassified Mesorhizobium]
MRAELGVHQQVLSADQVAALEPRLAAFESKGLYFPDSINVSDPKAVMTRLAAAATARGAQFMRASVTGLATGAGGVRLSGPGLAVTAQKVVIAASARSRPLAAQAGDRIPLDTERAIIWSFRPPHPCSTVRSALSMSVST